jgi:hypothetical protein
MKRVVLLIIVFVLINTNIFPQACGKSIRNIQFDFEKTAKKPEKIYYKLFYLLPKRADRYVGLQLSYEFFRDDEKLAFLSPFIYDNPKPPNRYFWMTNDTETKFIEIPADKAIKYINVYKIKDFEGVLFGEWWEHHLPQLWGNTCNGVLELKTSETDNVPFLMEVSAEGYENLYFVSNFLGGCFNVVDGVKPFQHIQMRAKKK